MSEILENFLKNDLLRNFVRAFELPETSKCEKTIFDIGLRGHFENPTSDLLAFFLDPNEDHGLGNLVLKILLQSAKIDIQESLQDVTVVREWLLNDGKRIDIVLEGTHWVAAIENKIYSGPNNDFEAYMAAIKQRYPESRNKYFFILAPYDPNIQNWQWLSTVNLMRTIKTRLGDIENIIKNKWIVLLSDLCEYLMTLFGSQHMNESIITKISTDIIKIKEISDVYETYVVGVNNLLSNDVKVFGKKENWRDLGTALKFKPTENPNYIVVFLIASTQNALPNNNLFRVQFYIRVPKPNQQDLNAINLEGFWPGGAEERGILHVRYADFKEFSDAKGAFLKAINHCRNHDENSHSEF